MLLGYELKKLLTAPAMIGFCLLCCIFNLVIIYGVDKHGLSSAIPINTSEMSDIFDDYDAVGIIAERYLVRHNLAGDYAQNVIRKYEGLQPVIDQKAQQNESLSPYFGAETPFFHQLLFQKLFRAMAIESSLLALFGALISTGYERARGTEGMIYGSKSGRSVLRTKFFASLMTGGIGFGLVFGVSLLLFLARFDLTHVWHANVSSLFNRAVDEYAKPFITWHSFRVSEFVWAYAGISAGVVLCFNLLGFAVGAWIRSGYGAVITVAATVGMMIVTEPLFPYGSNLRSALNLTPVSLWLNAGEWFTDGYADILWPHFESVGVGVSIAVLMAVRGLAAVYFRKRDLL